MFRGVQPVTPTDADLREIYDAWRIEPGLPPGTTYEQLAEVLRTNTSLPRLLGIRNVLRDQAAKVGVVVNPRYRPLIANIGDSDAPDAARPGRAHRRRRRPERARLRPVARVVLLVTSPRLPAGLLTAEAWDLVRAHPVRRGRRRPAGRRRCGTPGVAVTVSGAPDADALLADADAHGTVVWLAGPAGDEALARELGLRLAREPGRAELELMYGSWDPPGARLLDAVAVMDRLVAPDGDPWKRSQTHRSLAPYLLEEAYEAYDAIVADDLARAARGAGRRAAADRAARRGSPRTCRTTGWSVDDVAGGLVDKLIRRNPHVFAGAEVDGARRDRRQLGADQEGGEGARLGAGRHRARPARAGAGGEGAGAASTRPDCPRRRRCRPTTRRSAPCCSRLVADARRERAWTRRPRCARPTLAYMERGPRRRARHASPRRSAPVRPRCRSRRTDC